MKVIKNLFFRLLLPAIFTTGLKAQEPKVFFLNDTTYECSGLKMKLGKSYWKPGVMKINLTIINTNDFPVVIDPEGVTMLDFKGVEKNAKSGKLIVIPSKDPVKVRFVIKDLILRFNDPLALTIKGIGLANPRPETFSQLVFPAKLNTIIEEKSLSLKVTEVTQRDEDFAVKVEMTRSSNNIITISHPHANLLTEQGRFSNNRESSSLFNKKEAPQKMLMIFPYVKKHKEKEPTVDLNNVFKEYPITSLKACSFKLRPISEKEFENKREGKDEKEEVIEEID